MFDKHCRQLCRTVAVTFVLVANSATLAFAGGPGQEDLDQAVALKIAAKNPLELGQVIRLCERALEKGLDAGHEEFCRSILNSCRQERGLKVGELVVEKAALMPNWPQLRRVALADLEKLVKADASIGEAQLMIARLHVMPGGDRQRALEAAGAAIKTLSNPDELSIAHAIRGRLADDSKQQRADLDAAVKFDPTNLKARRTRAIFLLTHDEPKAALKDFDALLEADKRDVVALQGAGEAHAQLKQFDKALEHLDRAVRLDPNSHYAHLIRARVHLMKNDIDRGLEDLAKVGLLDPSHIPPRLLRARIRAAKKKTRLAQRDVEHVLELKPDHAEALLLKSRIQAGAGDIDKAISGIKTLIRREPEDPQLKFQLAGYYMSSGRSSKAAEIFTELIRRDPNNWQALRGRGDAYLNHGKHAEAIADFEAVLRLRADDPSTLNNLAWVLSTSPQEKLRDAQRAIKLAKKACALTDYQEAHILSTLAAAYAEAGDFETAKKWSQKSIEIGGGPQVEQLKKELQSYQQQKPWRELMQEPERPSPPSPDDLDS